MNSSTTRVLPQPRLGVPPRPRPPVASRSELSNGVRLVTVPRGTLPQVGIRLVVPVGATADPAGRAGLAALTGSLLTEGTESLSSEEFNRRVDRLGMSISVQVGHDFTEIDLLLLRETVADGLELLGEILAAPAFPVAEFERIRAESIEALQARVDEPGNVADDGLAQAVFGMDHPYARIPLGEINSVESLTREDVIAFHQAYFRPVGAVLVAAGDLDEAAFTELLESKLSHWQGEPDRSPSPVWHLPNPRRQRVDLPWPDPQQAEIRVGGPGMRRDAAGWIPAALANYLLGGSTITGRLGANLREDKGWTYGVRSGFSGTLQTGAWGIETAVDHDVADAAIDEIVAELEEFCNEPVPEDELRRGKDALILSLPRAFETAGRIVARMSTVEIFGLAPDYWERFPDQVEAVTAEEIQRIARSYFNPQRLAVVAVGA